MNKKKVINSENNIYMNELKSFSTNIHINDVYLFPNKNILVLGNDTYKIYNKKEKCIREKNLYIINISK